jgi:hypothetical protein
MEKLIRASTHTHSGLGEAIGEVVYPVRVSRRTRVVSVLLGWDSSFLIEGAVTLVQAVYPQDPARLTAMIAHPTTIDIHVAVN